MPQQGANKWIITITVILASMIELIDTSIVNVALPQMMGNLGATLDQIAWVVTGYVVANVIVIPMTSWFALGVRAPQLLRRLARPVHRRLVLLRPRHAPSGSWCSSASSRARAAAPCCRPRRRSWSRPSRPRSWGSPTRLFGLGVVVGPTVGPTLGGWITDSYSWRWIFYVNLPIGVVAVLMALAFLPDAKEARTDHLASTGRGSAC